MWTNNHLIQRYRLAATQELVWLSSFTHRRAQVACGDRVREVQSIYECLIPDLRYARSRLLYFDCAILAWPVLLKRYPEPHGQVTAYNRSPVH